jgi:hemolysin activation/secretion protein
MTCFLSNRLLMTGAFFAIFSPILYAQSAGNTPDAGSLLRDLEAQQPRESITPKLGSGLPAPLPESGETITLKAVVFQNYEGIATEADLQRVVQDAIGQQLGFNGLQHLANKVTEYLNDQGYFLAFAYLPQQDIGQGILTIIIQPGRIEGNGKWERSITAGEGINLSDDRIFNTLNHSLRPDQNNIVRATKMERGMLVFNDLAGVKASANLQRGREFGTTRVSVTFRSTPRYTGNAWVDNYGSYYTGQWRANAMGHINNLSGMGDRLGAIVTQTTDQSYGRINYNAPIGYNGLTASTGISYLSYTLGQELEIFDLNGTALSINAGLKYPIIRSRQTNLYIQGQYDYKDLKDYQANAQNKDRIYHNLILTLNGDNIDRYFQGGMTQYGLTLTYGDLNRQGNAIDYQSDQNTAQTHGTFHKLNANLSRMQKLSNHLSLHAALNLQILASGNLDSGEKFTLGGVNGVRAYAGGEGSGDEGWLTSLELRYDLPGVVLYNGGFQLQGFIDHGQITLDKAPWGVATNNKNVNRYSLTGSGIGVSWSQPQRYQIKAAYGVKFNDDIDERTTTGKDSEGKETQGRFWLQAMVWF